VIAKDQTIANAILPASRPASIVMNRDDRGPVQPRFDPVVSGLGCVTFVEYETACRPFNVVSQEIDLGISPYQAFTGPKLDCEGRTAHKPWAIELLLGGAARTGLRWLGRGFLDRLHLGGVVTSNDQGGREHEFRPAHRLSPSSG
jgi:hypothetical protein